MTTTTRNILIVDDEPDIRDSVADILNDFGYETETACDGPDALAKLRNRPYDVALLDFKMPGMDGLTLFREMRHVSPETSAILISAYTGDGLAEEALGSGIRRVISKPVDMNEVIAEVDRQLERPVALVVDDDSDFCQSIRDVLDAQGFRVSIAEDESVAVRLLDSRQPNVVLLDIKLGEGSDVSRVFKAIRTSNTDTGIVLITGHRPETESIIKELMSNGAAAVCFKPLDVQCLIGVLQKLV
ncbi:MAG: two-component system response regulator HydG [Planctomycetaceae bacterium]|jgi:two-component system response regulator HydG